jgi:hypothetical protein
MTTETAKDTRQQNDFDVSEASPRMQRLADRITPEWRRAFLILTETGDLVEGFLDHLEKHPDDQAIVDEALAYEEALLSSLTGLGRPTEEATRAPKRPVDSAVYQRRFNSLPTRDMVGELLHRALKRVAGKRTTAARD